MRAVQARAHKVTLDARGNLDKWLTGMKGCTIVRGHARFESADTVRVGDALLTAPRIFINVGGRATVPDMPGIGTVPILTNTDIARAGRPARASRGGRRQLHRPRVRPDVPSVRRARDRRREGPAPDRRARTRTCPRPSARSSKRRASPCAPTPKCIALAPHAQGVAVGVDCTSGDPQVIGRHVLLAVGRTPNTDDLGLERAGVATDARGYIPVDDELSDERPRHLGDRRLQRPRRLHPHGLQRLRDRRRQPARRRAPQGERPHPRLRPVHRPAARPGRHDGSRRRARRGRPLLVASAR